MSNFIVADEKVNRNPQAANKMDTDLLRGFRTAARNNQPRIAMEYLVFILELIDEKLGEDGDSVAELASPETAAPKKVAAKTAKTVAAEAALEGESVVD